MMYKTFFSLLFSLLSFNSFGQNRILHHQPTDKYCVVDTESNDTILGPYFDDIYSKSNSRSFLVEKEGSCGAYDSEGKLIVPIIYHAIAVEDNFIVVYTNEEKTKAGLYNLEGKLVIDTIYDYIGEVSDGIVRANYGGEGMDQIDQGLKSGINSYNYPKGGNWVYIDTNGRTISDLSFSYIEKFKNGFGEVYFGGEVTNWGVSDGVRNYLSVNGELVVADTSINLRMENGYFISSSEIPEGVQPHVDKVINSEKFEGLYNKKGKKVLSERFSNIEVFSDDIIVCKSYYYSPKKGRFSISEVYNNKGKKIIHYPIDKIYDFEKNLVYFRSNNKWGVYSFKGQELLPPIYQEINDSYLYNGLLIRNDINGERKYGILDTKGDLVFDVIYDSIFGSSGLIITKHGENFICRNNNKEIINIECEFMQVIEHSLDYTQIMIISQQNNRSVIYDSSGKRIFEMDSVTILHLTGIGLEWQGHDSSYVFVGEKNGKQGLITLDKRILIPFIFDEIVGWHTYQNVRDVIQYAYLDNYIPVIFEGKKTAINRNSRILYPPVKVDYQIEFKSRDWEKNLVVFKKVSNYDTFYGAGDTLGNIISEPRWSDEICILPDNHYLGYSDYKYHYIENGSDSIKYIFDNVAGLGNLKWTDNIGDYSYLYGKSNSEWYALDLFSNELNKSLTVDEIYDTEFECRMSKFSRNGKYGVLSSYGKFLIPSKYDDLKKRGYYCYDSEYHKENGQEYAAKMNGKWGGITTKGKQLTEFIYDSPDEVWEGEGSFYKE